MFNVKQLIDSIELRIELEELKEIGLTSEEIEGYVDFFYDDCWTTFDIKILN